MTTLCDSLENVLTYFWENLDAMKDGVESNIFTKLCMFMYIFVFYILADNLHILSILSHIF